MENQKLELKHLAPYLQYDVKIKDNRNNTYLVTGFSAEHGNFFKMIELMDNNENKHFVNFVGAKPILRPLSDLSQIELLTAGFSSHIDYLTHELQNKDNHDRIDSCGKKLWRVEAAPYEMVAYLFENHFDVFGLIEKGLAVDINTLKNG